MKQLIIGTRRFTADEASIGREAERLWRLSPERRGSRIEAAKNEIVRQIAAGGTDGLRRPVAVLLSAGIREI
jgi:hypothetical protein